MSDHEHEAEKAEYRRDMGEGRDATRKAFEQAMKGIGGLTITPDTVTITLPPDVLFMLWQAATAAREAEVEALKSDNSMLMESRNEYMRDCRELVEALADLCGAAEESWPDRPCVEYARAILAKHGRGV